MTRTEITWKAKRIVAELPFIPAASNWLKLLLSMLAEPLMFVSSLYIVAETVIPGAATWSAWLTNGTNTVMSLAPEIVLPGCFQQAQFAMNHGNKVRGYLLYGLCALFGILTIVTLASFVWHFTAIVGATLLFVRCGSGISYTIILNIAGPEEAMQPARLHVDNTRIETLAETVETLASTVDEISQDVLQLLDRTNTPPMDTEKVMQTIQAMMQQAVQRLTEDSVTLVEETVRQAMQSLPVYQPVQISAPEVDTEPLEVVEVSTLDTEASTLDSEVDTEHRIRTLLLEDSSLSVRALASRAGCSPTTASKWKARIEKQGVAV